MGKNYTTQERVIDGYALTKYTTNKDGVMDKNVIVVTYYYAKAKAPQEQPKEDKLEMLEALGLEESGLDKLIKASYKLLGLMSFLTAGEPEVRAWTIKIGTKAPQAAGKIHSDIERGFIRAEVVSYDDLIACGGSMVNVKEKGLMRLEGKEYGMQDGDIVLFRFNV